MRCGVGWRGGAGGSVELELAARTVDFGRRWERLSRFGSRCMNFMIFMPSYNLYLTDADEEVNKWTGACARVLHFVPVYLYSLESLSRTDNLKDSTVSSCKLRRLVRFT